YRSAGFQEFAACPVQRPDHRSQDQHQQNLFPDRPFLPRHGHQLADLVDREGPDDLDEMEDGSDPLLQEFQELVEDLFHGRDSVVRTTFKTSPDNARSRVAFRSRTYKLRAVAAPLSGYRRGIEQRQIVVDAPAIRPRLGAAARNVEDQAEQLPAGFFDGHLA